MFSFLVIVHSTIFHGNDLMSQITSQLKALNLPQVEVCMMKQLPSELATKMGKVDYVIFVDVCEMRDTNIKVIPLNACGFETPGSSVPGLGHSWHPCSLLALTHSLYFRHPISWWIKVAHENLTGEHQASDEDNQIIKDAIEQIQRLIDSEQTKKAIESENSSE